MLFSYICRKRACFPMHAWMIVFYMAAAAAAAEVVRVLEC